jgi:coenzyme F420-reducing hydrogenase beta subunit
MACLDNGDLAPVIVDESPCRDNCNLCVSVCPFADGVHDPRTHNVELFDSSVIPKAKYNEDIGWHIRSVVGYRKQPELRDASASGGLATWMLETLLEEGDVTRIAIVKLAQDKDKGFFEFYTASSVEQLRMSSGSVYHPVEISEIVKEIATDKQQRWAVVGVPCLCSAIHNLKHLRQQIPFVFGLACGMYQNTYYTELLLAKSGVNRQIVTNIEYRRKSDSGTPSNYRFRGTDNQRIGREVQYKGLPFFLGKHAYFRQNSCNYCKDVFAETADACFMDAWLPDYSKEPKGTSLVLIRNSQIDQLFSRFADIAEIEIENISSEDIVASQRGHVRRKRVTISTRLNSVIFGGMEDRIKLCEKIEWWLQKRTQIRSKAAWSKWGRKYGFIAFWIAMLDILILQILFCDVLPRAISFPRRIIRKTFG